MDAKTPGFRRGRKLKKVGNHAQNTAELFFDDMHVPADALLGESEFAAGRNSCMGLPRNAWWSPCARWPWRVLLSKQRSSMCRNLRAWANGHHLTSRTARFKLCGNKTDIDVGQPFFDQCIAGLADGTLSPEMAAKAKLQQLPNSPIVLDDCVQLRGYGYMCRISGRAPWADAACSPHLCRH